MKDIALVNEGTRVYFATCRDDRYPLNNIIDGKWDTFWPTTGLFPHSFIVTFKTLMKITSVAIQSYNVKLLRIDKSKHDLPTEFDKYVGEHACEHKERRMHTYNIKETCVARHLKFIIVEGHDHFAAVHNLAIMADPTNEEKFSNTFFRRSSNPNSGQEEITANVNEADDSITPEGERE